MTPHLSEDPWTGVALGLERLTGIRGIVDRTMTCEDNVDMERFSLAVKEIAVGRVAVSKRWLAELIQEVPWRVLPALGLSADDFAQSEDENLDWMEKKDIQAARCADQVRFGILRPAGVRFKKDKDEG